ncbi:hypothetical protein MBLNU13_g06720t1 [Cladosporium sp. NU13]
MSVSHYDREAEDRLPPTYSSRPNSIDNDNDRIRDAEEGRNERRRSLTFVESLFVDVPQSAHIHQSTRVITTEVPQPLPQIQPPARPRLRMRLTRKSNRSKRELACWVVSACCIFFIFVAAFGKWHSAQQERIAESTS